ncbi:MAG TPA: MFS transporter [Terriglobales bacterium]|nr:MFS transporter [Terriglobales bacterium]
MGHIANAMLNIGAPDDSRGIRWGTPRARWVIGATVGASGLAMLDATAVNVALPAIGSGLGTGVAGLQWTVNAYTLSLASMILLAGSLGDRYGRRRIFQIGVGWFALASLLCAAAPTTGTLIAARALQGVGGALLTPGSLAILQTSFAPGDRGRAIGAWSGLGGIAAAVGPLLGGWLVGVASWRAIFWTNLPVAALVLWITKRHVPESRAGESHAEHTRFDLVGAALGALGLGAFTWALIAAGDRGASPVVIAAGGVGVLALVAFLLVERSARTPLVPLDLFASRQFAGVNLVTFVIYGGMAGLFFLLVVYLQKVAGYPPLRAGTALTPVTLLMLLLSSRAGELAERIGPRRPMTIGPLVMAAGMLLLAHIGQEPSYTTDVLPGTVLFGLGLSATVAPLTATALASAGAERSGVASGVNNAVARTAALLAVAVLPVVAGLTGDAFSHADRFAVGFRVAMRISAALVSAGGVLAWLTIRDEGAPGKSACDRERVACRTFCAVDGPPIEPRADLLVGRRHPAGPVRSPGTPREHE